jgi:hypothetical protein
LLDAIRVLAGVNVGRADHYRLLGNLSRDGRTLAGTTAAQALAVGVHQVELIIPTHSLRRRGLSGPFIGVVLLQNDAGESLGSLEFGTAVYEAENFSAFALPQGAWTEDPVDTNGNGLFDLLRITQPISIVESGDYVLSAKLFHANGATTVYADTHATLIKGLNVAIWDFSGPLIFGQQLDGPYQVEVVVRDASTGTVRDRLILPQFTSAYDHRSFDDALRGGTVVLTGNSADIAIDANGNGLFDQLRVDLGVSVPETAAYEWSARLEDAYGKELGFYTGQGSIDKGPANIQFLFDGKPIGKNAVDGPVRLRGLLVFAPGQVALLALDAAITKPYQYTEFEGVPAKGDLDGDGDIDRDDLAIVLAARGSLAEGPHDPRDLDGDGKVTALDTRKLVLLFTRPGGAKH